MCAVLEKALVMNLTHTVAKKHTCERRLELAVRISPNLGGLDPSQKKDNTIDSDRDYTIKITD